MVGFFCKEFFKSLLFRFKFWLNPRDFLGGKCACILLLFFLNWTLWKILISFTSVYLFWADDAQGLLLKGWVTATEEMMEFSFLPQPKFNQLKIRVLFEKLNVFRVLGSYPYCYRQDLYGCDGPHGFKDKLNMVAVWVFSIDDIKREIFVFFYGWWK